MGKCYLAAKQDSVVPWTVNVMTDIVGHKSGWICMDFPAHHSFTGGSTGALPGGGSAEGAGPRGATRGRPDPPPAWKRSRKTRNSSCRAGPGASPVLGAKWRPAGTGTEHPPCSGLNGTGEGLRPAAVPGRGPGNSQEVPRVHLCPFSANHSRFPGFQPGCRSPALPLCLWPIGQFCPSNVPVSLPALLPWAAVPGQAAQSGPGSQHLLGTRITAFLMVRFLPNTPTQWCNMLLTTAGINNYSVWGPATSL